MNVKVFLVVQAALAIIYGVAFVLVPAFVLVTYGMTTEPSTILSGRYFGATLLAVGLMAWFLKETSDRAALRGVLSGLAISYVVGLLVSIWGTLTSIMNGMGWSAVLIYVVLLAGCTYCLFADRTVTGRT